MPGPPENAPRPRGRGWRAVPVLLGIAVSGGCLALALRQVRWAEIFRSFDEVRPALIPGMVALMLFELWLRAVRWRLLLSEAAPRAGVGELWSLEAIGLAVNNITFLRLGELARAFLAGRELKISVMTSLASICVERLLDMTTLMLLLAAASRLYPGIVPGPLAHAAWAVGLGCLLALAALARAEGWVHWRQGLAGLSGYPRLAGFLEKTALGAGPLYSRSLALQIAALSLAVWVVDTGLYWTAAQAMRLSPELQYGQTILVLASAAAAAFVPAVPGSFGTFEKGVQACLTRLGVDGASALAYAGFVHVINYLVVTGLGILCLYRAGYTLARLKSLHEEEDPHESPARGAAGRPAA